MPSAAPEHQEVTGRKANGTFAKGASGNPGGRPAIPNEVREAIKQAALGHCEMAIERLAEWAEDSNPRASIPACVAILERGLGKAAQPITGEDLDGPVEITIRYVSSGHA